MMDKFICSVCGAEIERIDITGYGNFVPEVCSCGTIYMVIVSLDDSENAEYHIMDYEEMFDFFDNNEYVYCMGVSPEDVREYYMKAIDQELRQHKIEKLIRGIV
jgi:hypothetical protein